MSTSRMVRTGFGIAAVALLVMALAGCGSGGSGGSSTGGTGGATGTTISEENISFNPASTSVKVGDTVTFVNNDSTPHEVSIDGKDLGRQAVGESVTWTPTKAGSYPYKCIIHPSMTGEITVTQ